MKSQKSLFIEILSSIVILFLQYAHAGLFWQDKEWKHKNEK